MVVSTRRFIVAIIPVAILASSAACSRDYSEVTTPATATAEFSRVRQQLGNSKPLVEIIKDNGDCWSQGNPCAAVVHRSAADQAGQIQSFHALVYEMPSRKLLRVNLPFRAVRLLRRSGFTYLGQFYFLEDTEFDPIHVGLSLDDVERHGRGLLVDYRRPSGAQFLAWVD
jgi:hypothetical protein